MDNLINLNDIDKGCKKGIELGIPALESRSFEGVSEVSLFASKACAKPPKYVQRGTELGHRYLM